MEYVQIYPATNIGNMNSSYQNQKLNINKMKKQSQQSIELEKIDKQQSNGKPIVITINDTPFNIVEHKEEILITIGNEVLKKCETVESAVKYIESKPWELILNACAIYSEYITKTKKEKKDELM